MRKKQVKAEKTVDFNKVCEKLLKISSSIKKLDKSLHDVISFISMVKKPVRRKKKKIT